MAGNESAEMYLETIYLLSKKKSPVRSIDIAEQMNYSKPSVSRAIGLLKERKYIIVDKEGGISLTDDGTKLAEKIFERHTVLSDILKSLGVSEDTADEDACRIEHIISEETFNAIKKHFEK